MTRLDITGVFLGERPKSMILAANRFEEFLDSVHLDIINFYEETSLASH